MKKIITTISLAFLLLARSAFAVDAPDFPSCPNPGGNIIASYNDGVHGVPGNPTTFTGEDKVYKIDDIRTVQCLCLEDKTGIQTNWWKTSSLTQEQIDTLKKLDWIFIPTGSVWGLDQSAYMAKNLSYSCGADNTLSTFTTGSVLGLATTGSQLELVGFASLGVSIFTLGLILRNRSSNE